MASSIRKNSIMMVLYETLSLIVPLILTPYISRVIGSKGIGIYSYSFSLVSYFMIAVQLGVKLYGRREIAKVNDNKYKYSNVFWEIISIQGGMFLISSFLYFIFVFLYNTDNVLKQALIIQYIEIVVGFLDISWFYYGIESFKIILYRNIIVRILQILLIFLFVRNIEDVNNYVLIMSICNLLGVLMMWISLKGIMIVNRITFHSVLNRIFPMLVLFVPVISTQLFSIVDKTIIGAYLSVDKVGEFENAYKIAKIPLVVVTAVGSVLLPRITKLIADGKENEGKQYISKSMNYVMFVSCGIAFGMYSIAPIFIPLYLGSGFNGSIVLLEILSFMIVFIGWGNVLRTQYMLPKGMDSLYTRSVVYASIVNIVFGFLFVTIMGVNGVALASLLGEIVICMYTNIKLSVFLDIKLLFKNNYLFIISGLIMSFGIKLISKNILMLSPLIEMLILLIFGFLLYFVSVVLFEIVTKRKFLISELMYIYKMIK